MALHFNLFQLISTFQQDAFIPHDIFPFFKTFLASTRKIVSRQSPQPLKENFPLWTDFPTSLTTMNFCSFPSCLCFANGFDVKSATSLSYFALL